MKTTEKPFTTITLSTGEKCGILNITPFMLWRAHSRMERLKELELNVVPFILEQIVIIEGKAVSMEYLGEMDINDYTKIIEVVDVQMKKLPL